MTTPTVSRESEFEAATDVAAKAPDIVVLGEWPAESRTAEPVDPSRLISNQPTLVGQVKSSLPLATAWVRSLRPSAVLALLLFTAAVLMLLDLRGGPTELLRSMGQSVGGSAQAWADQVIGPVQQTPLRRVNGTDLQARIDELEGRNGALEQQSAILQDQLRKSAQLQGLRTWTEAVGIDVVPGQVVASASGRAPGRMVTINIGRDQGLSPDLAVVAQGALVGRLIEVGRTSSTVQLISDSGSRVWARVSESRETMVAAGSGQEIEGQFLEPFAPVEVGQTLVTLGSPDSTPYPPGLPIATITGVAGDVGEFDRRVIASPIADLSVLETVGVVSTPKAGDDE